MHTSASRSPGSGGRGSGHPIARYQNDTPPFTGAEVAGCPSGGMLRCSLARLGGRRGLRRGVAWLVEGEDGGVLRAEGQPDLVVGVYGRKRRACTFADEYGSAVVHAYLDLARIAEVNVLHNPARHGVDRRRRRAVRVEADALWTNHDGDVSRVGQFTTSGLEAASVEVDPATPKRPAEERGFAEKLRDEQAVGMLVEVCRRTDLLDPPLVEHRDPVR